VKFNDGIGQSLLEEKLVEVSARVFLPGQGRVEKSKVGQELALSALGFLSEVQDRLDRNL
jgi:hypothetical protein